MTIHEILTNGENSYIEFKERFDNATSVAEEIVAFLNFKGGSILWGISDTGEVIGIRNPQQSIEERVMNICRENIIPPIIPGFKTYDIQGKRIARMIVSEGLEKPYRTKQGKYLIRIGSTKRHASREELARLFQNSLMCHNDDRAISGANSDVLNIEKLRDYFLSIYELDIRELPTEELQQLLINASVLSFTVDSVIATVVGLLFFARTDRHPVSPIERFLPHTGITLVHYADENQEEILDRFQSYAPCPEIIDDILHKIRLNWWQRSQIQGVKREETVFPEKVFRELLVNATVHRDYTIHSPIFVKMFPRSVEVSNPGRLVNTVTIDKMKAGISISRNPLIMKFMENYRYADRLGRGIPMIMNYVRRHSYLRIDLCEEDERFLVRLRLEE